MINMQLSNNPGYPTQNPNYLGFIQHSEYGVGVGVNPDYKSTLEVRRYLCGLEQPNYPMPAIPYKVIWPWAWSDIDQTNQCYVTLVRVDMWNDEYFEGSFVKEWCILPALLAPLAKWEGILP